MHSSIVFTITAMAATASAHGFIETFKVDGVDYEGFSKSNPSPSPDAIGWSFSTPDEGPVLDLQDPNFICRMEAVAAKSSAPIVAGGEVEFLWTSADKERNPDGWSQGHRGPIIAYIAPCDGDCQDVDKTTLRWTKIAEAGLISGPANTEGVWATDEMRANGGWSSATIPASIAPGNYVIRHEIVALHRANLAEPEFYAQCGSLTITSGGADTLADSGVLASELYSTADTQIYGFSIYDSRETSWEIPGPPLYKEAAAGSSGSVPDVETPSPTEVVSPPPAEDSEVPGTPIPTPTVSLVYPPEGPVYTPTPPAATPTRCGRPFRA